MTKPRHDEIWLTISDLAKRLKISERHARNLCRDGRIDGAVQLGDLWRIRRDYRVREREAAA